MTWHTRCGRWSERPTSLQGHAQLPQAPLPNAGDILVGRDPLPEGVVLTDELVDKLMDYIEAHSLKQVPPSRIGVE